MTLRYILLFALALFSAPTSQAGQSPPPAAPQPYERPALAALAERTPPKAFPIEVNPLRVPRAGHPGLVAVFVNVPGGGLTFTGNTKTGTFVAGAVVLARFVNDAGATVHSESQEFPFHGLLSDAKATLAKRLAFSRIAEVPSGAYRLDVVVYDEAGKQASVTTMPFEIPPPTMPIVGDLMVVDRAEKLPPDKAIDPANPFVRDGVLLHPAIDAGVNRGLQPEITFLLPIVLAAGEPAPPAELALLSDKGNVLATISLPMRAPDPDGGLMTIGRIPLARVPPGKYQLQVSIGATHPRVRTTWLTVVD
jgi:hypothetical protein